MKIIVIGGGAAGMMAAISSAKQEKEQRGKSSKVILLEQNEKLGKKLFITGKGRCNLTNASDIEDMMRCFTHNASFLYSSIYGFANDQVVELMEQFGCPTKVERGNRVFPVSDHSSDVIAALKKALLHYGVEIRLNTKVTSLLLEEDCCKGVRLQDGSLLTADKVIVATGGYSYQSTGSTGDGYRFAEQAGHQVYAPVAGLVPFETVEDYPKELMGLSLRNVKLTVRRGKKKLFEEQGEMLFTHFGVSGPLVLSASMYVPRECRNMAKELTASIDLKPALSKEQLEKRLLREFDAAKNKTIKTVLASLLPSAMVPVALRMLTMSKEQKIHDVTKEERGRIVELLKAFPFTIKGLRDFSEAIITRGGVNVKEIDPSTMASKLVKQLYFAGEVLDLDALTGGYNLQIAWSTGYAAGLLQR